MLNALTTFWENIIRVYPNRFRFKELFFFLGEGVCKLYNWFEHSWMLWSGSIGKVVLNLVSNMNNYWLSNAVILVMILQIVSPHLYCGELKLLYPLASSGVACLSGHGIDYTLGNHFFKFVDQTCRSRIMKILFK